MNCASVHQALCKAPKLVGQASAGTHVHAKSKKQEKKAWWRNRIRPHEGYHYSACTYYM